MNLDAITADLKDDEGLRLKPYVDSVGKLSIGWGRNLTDDGISASEAEAMLSRDQSEAVQDVVTALPWCVDASEPIQRVLIELCFNMGLGTLLGFRKMLAAMEAGDIETAVSELEASEWYGQVGTRGPKMVARLRSQPPSATPAPSAGR